MEHTEEHLQPRTWERDDNPALKPQRTGAWVKSGGQLGFAKGTNLGQEWLAAKLGELAKAQVAGVEFGIVAHQPSVVSHVRSPASAPLGCKNYSDSVMREALGQASGLIAFLTWIGAEDHAKPENYVATPVGGGAYVEAIDFEHSFGGQLSAEFSKALLLPELLANADSERIQNGLNAILLTPEECVRACCERSKLRDWREIADQLVSRRQNLPQWLTKEGLIA